MKYKTAKDIIENIKTYEPIDGDLILFMKPFSKIMTFKLKDGTMTEINLKDCSYASMSNHGFLFVKKDTRERVAVQLNNVADIVVK